MRLAGDISRLPTDRYMYVDIFNKLTRVSATRKTRSSLTNAVGDTVTGASTLSPPSDVVGPEIQSLHLMMGIEEQLSTLYYHCNATAARPTKSPSIKRLIHRYALCVAARGTCDWTDNP